ncbi:GntR family transcriptional regulator [Olleya sp. YS]|uniref:GntR family transcriptional regulator n=1 Tax=Olleya sp. YS TaxID=3028318 RepID=UPI00243430F7|nr:GntR family transcriptional regulator [Olleya sp. YS]WGD34553.1 GntR family transcriptional regulator [Olleya sp. YS]
MIIKITLRDQIKTLLIQKMREGKLVAGQSLSLAGLARELDVSVTPIREALTQLQQVNIIEAIPNKGFIIKNISKEEAINLYQLIATIEALAVQNSTFKTSTIKDLKKQESKLRLLEDGLERINADIKFHDILISDYDSEIAKQILSDLKTRIFFYELEFMKSKHFFSDSNNHHEIIINHIENNQLIEAAEIVKDNWLQILKFINNETESHTIF